MQNQAGSGETSAFREDTLDEVNLGVEELEEAIAPAHWFVLGGAAVVGVGAGYVAGAAVLT